MEAAVVNEGARALGFAFGGPELVVLLVVLGLPVAVVLVILAIVNSNRKKDE